MSTLRKEYARKFSSGLTLAILALSGILFLVPVATPVVATNAVAPAISVSPNVIDTSAPFPVAVTISNPSSNQYAITAFTVTGPSGWTFTGPATGTYFTCIASGASLACTELVSGVPLPPGASDSLSVTETTLTAPTTTTYPVKATFATAVQDASSAAYYSGKSFPVYVIDSTTTVSVSVSPNVREFMAGSTPYTVTATVGGTVNPTEAGLPISWTVGGPGVGTVSTSSGTTGTSGTASVTFTPTNNAAATLNTNYVIATLGSDAAAIAANTTATEFTGSSFTFQTFAGTPKSVLLTYSSTGGATSTSPAFPSTHYLIQNNATSTALGLAWLPGTDVYFSVADAFGNPVTTATVTAGTITAAAGYLCPSVAPAYPCTPSVSTLLSSGNLGTMGYDYYQSGTYGWTGELSVSLSGTYGTTSFSGIHSATNRIVTSAFAGSAAGTGVTVTPALTTPVVEYSTFTNVTAGSYQKVAATFDPLQEGVPVTLQICTSCTYTTSGYSGGFGTTHTPALAGTTNSSGMFRGFFYVDTTAFTEAQVNATWSQTTDGPTITPYTSALPSNPMLTIAGPPAKFVILTGFGSEVAPATTTVVNGTTASVDITLADAYGNPTTAPTGPQIQISLSASAGLFSATTVYIPGTDASTNATLPVHSFGAIDYTAPVSIGTTVTLTATGVINGVAVRGSSTITTVSDTPTISVTSPAPYQGVIYSNNPTVVFTGEANVSIGYPTVTTDGVTAVTIYSVGIKVGSGAWSSATIVSGTSDVTWSAVAFLTVGLNTVTFNATDSNTNVVLTSTYQVLVETAAPTINFVTPSGAKLNYTTPLQAKITDSEGDLNATSVSATANGTALVASDISLSGTNNLGHSVTYSVSIKNLPVGNWTIVLSASNYAQNTGTNTTSVTVLVSFAQSVVINSAAKGTLGAFVGISVSATNLWSTSQNLVVFAVFKNSVGQTVAVATGGLTLGAGATGTAFATSSDLASLPSGTYTVNVFVITTANYPVSSTSSISVTL